MYRHILKICLSLHERPILYPHSTRLHKYPILHYASLYVLTVLRFSLKKKLRIDIFLLVFTECNKNTKLSSWNLFKGLFLTSSPKQLYFYRSLKIIEIVSRIIAGRSESLSRFYFPFFKIPVLLRISNF